MSVITSNNEHMKFDKYYLGEINPPQGMYKYRLSNEIDITGKPTQDYFISNIKKNKKKTTKLDKLFIFGGGTLLAISVIIEFLRRNQKIFRKK